MMLSHLEMSNILRDELATVLQGSGITWNLKGILNAYDRAVAVTAFKVVKMESERELDTYGG